MENGGYEWLFMMGFWAAWSLVVMNDFSYGYGYGMAVRIKAEGVCGLIHEIRRYGRRCS
jgi:hypothetical protein